MIHLLIVIAAETFASPFIAGIITGWALVHKFRSSTVDGAGDVLGMVIEGALDA